ncbi:hypothetical protein BB558_000583 [Smittium angustum]|uniref:Dipeptidyl-peptidase IV n=1 Tax=Smittium angustum TaxID=133377 RepID=A0A2U1JDZ9_SMIAN|nr:hypothetical protein BB558_000583 [Smittium angustum]
MAPGFNFGNKAFNSIKIEDTELTEFPNSEITLGTEIFNNRHDFRAPESVSDINDNSQRQDFNDSTQINLEDEFLYGDENFDMADDERFYREFSSLEPNRYQSLNQSWRKTRFSLLQVILIIGTVILGFGFVYNYMSYKSPEKNTPKAESNTSSVQDESKHVVITPQDKDKSESIEYSNQKDATQHPSQKNTTRSHLNFENYWKRLYQPTMVTVDFVKHPNNSSIDGIFADFTDEFIINSIDDSFNTVIASKSDILSALESAGLDMGTFFVSTTISPDWKFVLLETDRKKLFRHSTVSTFHVYDVEKKIIKPLISTSLNNKISLAQWAPTGHSVSFVAENDLYVSDTINLERVSNTGSKTIFNGVADWVYEEEVLENSNSHWWSPDGKMMIYLQLDDTNVPDMKYPVYDSASKNNSYPEIVSIKYPKPGYPNPEVKIFIYSASFSEEKPQNLDFLEKDSIVTQVSWITEDHMNAIVKVSNRVQNHFKIYLLSKNPDSTYSHSLIREVSSIDKDHAWIDITKNMIYIPKNFLGSDSEEGYIDLVDKNGFTHFGLFTPITSNTPKLLTQGNYDIIDGTVQLDDINKILYFGATIRSSYSVSTYSIDLRKLGEPQQVAPINYPPNPSCETNGSYSMKLSSYGKYATINYSGPGIPWNAVYSINSGSITAAPVISLSDNKELRENLKDVELPKIEYLTIPGIDGYADLDCNLILPPGFDPSKKNKYSVLFNVYGGPNSKFVDERYKFNSWNAVAVSESANNTAYPDASPLVVVNVDPRGTNHKGRSFSRAVSGELGTLEAIDVARTAEYLLKKYSCFDRSRVGIWGWSYGGFLTLRVLESFPKLFSLGISVAPVTNWKFYDTVYTERYLKTPSENPEGYMKSAVSNYGGLASTKLLLMHGTGDDNVHIQNTFVLIDKLQEINDQNLTLMAYPDSDHSIARNNARKYLDTKMVNFLFGAFGG